MLDRLRQLTPHRRKRLGQAAVLLFGLLMAALVVRLLQAELRPEVWEHLPQAVEALPRWRIVAAVVVAVVDYTWLGWFDRLGFFVVQVPMSTPFALRTGFMGYAIAHNLGLAPITGTAFRARRYLSRGVPAAKVARLYGSNVVTMWLGYLLAVGTTLLVHPLGALPLGPVLQRVLGTAAVAIVVAYVVVAFVGVPPLAVRRIAIAIPRGRLALLQVLTGAVHWTLSASVLWLVLPGDLSLLEVEAALCTAQFAAAMSHIPGGVGVLEGTLILLLHDRLDSAAVIAGVLLFRLAFYLLPLALTVLMLLITKVAKTLRALREQRS